MSTFQPQTCPDVWLFLTGIPHKASISSHGSFNNFNSCIVRRPEVLNSCTSHCSQAFVNWKAFSLVYFRANVSLCSPNTCYSSDLKGQKYCRAEGCNHSSRRRGAKLRHSTEPSVSVMCFPLATGSTAFLTLQNQDLNFEGCKFDVKGQYLQEHVEYKLPGTSKGASLALANRTAEEPLVLLHFSKMQNG